MNATLYSNHAVDCADEMGLTIAFGAVSRTAHGKLPVAYAYAESRRVVFPYTIGDEDTYLACMHEIGHCADPGFADPAYRAHNRQLDREEFAWTWAMQNVAFPISVAGYRVIWRCFKSYLVVNGVEHHPFLDTIRYWAARHPAVPFPEMADRCGMDAD